MRFGKNVPPPVGIIPKNIAEFRSKLPVTFFKKKILETISNKEVTLITGGTGCGKTTQVKF